MNHITQQGYSFVEVLVAISILLIGLVGPLTIAATGLKNATFAKEQNIAFFLAQEAIEGAIYLREAGGLANLADDAVDPWAWVDALPANCFNDLPCRYNGADQSFTECASLCRLFFDSSSVVRYVHNQNYEPTPFRRRVFFEETNDHTLYIRVVVNWDANATGDEREIVMESYITNIYGN